MSETCERLFPNPPYGWKKYLERHTPHHFIESGYSARLITLLIRFPELIRYTVDIVVDEILKEKNGAVCKARAFLKHLVNSDQYISVITFIEITCRLVELEMIDIVNQSRNLIDSSHPYRQQIELILKMQKNSIEIESQDCVRQIGLALKEKGVPEILKGIFQYYLSEYFQLSGKYKLAQRSVEQAIDNLSPTKSFNYWMKSQFVMSKLEITFERSPDALARLSVLKKVAEAGNSTNYLATVHEICSQIY